MIHHSDGKCARYVKLHIRFHVLYHKLFCMNATSIIKYQRYLCMYPTYWRMRAVCGTEFMSRYFPLNAPPEFEQQ